MIFTDWLEDIFSLKRFSFNGYKTERYCYKGHPLDPAKVVFVGTRLSRETQSILTCI